MSLLQKVCLFAVIAAFVAGLASAAFAQRTPQRSNSAPVRMLKCTDAKGKVYYSDRPGPECGGSDVQELNRQGVVIQRSEPKPSAAAAQPKNETAQQRQERIEQERRDKALLLTYTTEQQIEESKHRSLELPLLAVKQNEAKLATAQKALDDLIRKREQHNKLQQPVPAALEENLRTRGKEVELLKAGLAERKEFAEEIRKRFDGDKARFREIKSASNP